MRPGGISSILRIISEFVWYWVSWVLNIADAFCVVIYSQDETSEMVLGEWMEKRGIRDQMVIATKVSGSCTINHL